MEIVTKAELYESKFNQFVSLFSFYKFLKFLSFADMVKMITLNRHINRALLVHLMGQLRLIMPAEKVATLSDKEVLFTYGHTYGKTILKFSIEKICSIIHPKNDQGNGLSIDDLKNPSGNNDSFENPKKGGKGKGKKSKAGKGKKARRQSDADDLPSKGGDRKNSGPVLPEYAKSAAKELDPEKSYLAKGLAVASVKSSKLYLIITDMQCKVYVHSLNPISWKNSLVLQLDNIKDIECPSNFVYLTTDGKLYVAHRENLDQSTFTATDSVLIAEGVEKFFSGYNYVFIKFIADDTRYWFQRNLGSHNFLDIIHEEKLRMTDNKQFFDLRPKVVESPAADLNGKAPRKKKPEPVVGQITKVVFGQPTVGGNSPDDSVLDFYFLTDQQRVYKGQFNEIKEPQGQGFTFVSMGWEEYAHLKGKRISQIFGSQNASFIALEDTMIPAFKEWDYNRVADWFDEIKLGKYRNSVFYKKASGKHILTADEDWFRDEIGLEAPEELVHINTEINQVRFTTYKDPVLYAWGSNSFKQLGINTGTKNVLTPYKFSIAIIDFYNNNDYVDNIIINNTASLIITKNGRFFQSYPEEVFSQIREKKSEIHNQKAARGVEKPKHHIDKDNNTHKKAASPVFWKDVTDWFNTDRMNIYKIEDSWTTTREFMLLASNLRVFSKKKEKKLPDAQKTWNRIKFDAKLDEREYLFGVKGTYWDLDEITYEMFAESERTWNGIKYFRHQPSGKIVWSRKMRINILDDLLELDEL